MTTIRTVCPQCGEVDLTPADITLIRGDVHIHYEFRCPLCGEMREKAGDRKIAALLMSAGVEVIQKRVEHVVKDVPPPINIDDLIEFHFQLENWDGDVI